MTDEEKVAAEAKAKADAEAKARQDQDPAFWQSEAKKAFQDRDAAKAEARKLEAAAKELADLKAAQMTEAEKTAARIKELEATEAEAKAARETFQKLLDADLAAVPEAMRGLVPNGTPAEKYAWVQSAKAAGVFGKQADRSQGAGIPGQGGGNTITKSTLANMPPGEKRNALMADIRAGKVSVIDG
jgi:membrane protein involved in colicin uptake